MSYTALRVDERGVVFYEEHSRRLSVAGDGILAQFRAFARTATPGIHSLRARDGVLEVQVRSGSRLFDGMPVRFMRSPFVDARHRFAKPAPPNEYESVRAEGVATLLTSADGLELYESCSAAIVGWNGTSLVLAPHDRPRVESVAENALRLRAAFVESPLLRESSMPIALVNAVKGVCLVDAPHRSPFPREAIECIERVLQDSTSRG